MALRNYSNTAVETSLTVGVDDTAGSITVGSVSGYPDAPFSITIDPDTEFEEACLVTLVSGLSLNVTRGIDGTAALPHVSGAVVKHAAIAADFREANEHVHETEYVHGTTSDVVGVSDAQTLSNKNISGLVNNITDIPMDSVAGLDDALDLKADLAGATFTGPVNLPAATTIGDVDATEISHLDGVTAPIQEQIDNLNTEVDAKAPLFSPTFTGNVTLPSSTSIGGVSAGEIAALDGVLANIQTQIDGITGGGIAVPPGGNTNDILVKLSDEDYAMTWMPLSALQMVPGVGSVNIYPDGALTSTDHDATGTFSIGAQTFRYYAFTTPGLVQTITATDWTSDGTTGVYAQLLVIGGGGGGGGYKQSSGDYGGGGGAGALWTGEYPFGVGGHTLTIGAGGNGGAGSAYNAGSAQTGEDGDPTYIDHIPGIGGGILCLGGGGGGGGGADVSFTAPGLPGRDGGNGGGGGYGRISGVDTTAAPGITLQPGYGYNGSGASGGGAGGPGVGLVLNMTGSDIEYADGGTPGSGAGVDGRGSGGGGAAGGGTSIVPGSPGGDGCVIVRYRIA